MKKILSRVLALALVVCLCVGCSSTVEETPTTTPVEESTETATTTDSTENQDKTAVESDSTTATEDTTSEVTPAPETTPEPEATPEPEDVANEALEVSIKDVFAQHGVKAGTCMNAFWINGGATEELILNQFNSITMENNMKPDYIFDQAKCQETGEVVISLNPDAVKMLDWAKKNGVALRGHTFVWYSQTPAWLFNENFDSKSPKASREVMLERMEGMIKGMFEALEEGGYLELFYAYDVVNEAVNDDGTLRSMWNNWYETVGEDYIWWAFYYANKYAPDYIDLYYNDYNEQFKTKYIVDLVKTLVDDEGNYLIDGIGCQAHLYTMDGLTEYFKHIDTIAALGLKVELTELDVELGAWQKDIPANEENYNVQGRYYYDLIGGLLERVDAGTLNLDAITFWGFNDALSWRKEKKPCLYYADQTPKPAFYGAAQVKELAGYEEE